MTSGVAGKQMYSLSHSQKRFWYTDKIYPGTGVGNVILESHLKERVDLHQFEQALNQTVMQNDALRLKVEERDGTLVQYVSDFEPVKLEVLHFSGKKELREWIRHEAGKPLPLERSILHSFTMAVVNESHIFVPKIHHSICDGWGLSLLLNQTYEHYSRLRKGQSLSDTPKPSYTDFIRSEEKYKDSARFRKNRDFWREKFATLPEPLELSPKRPALSDISSEVGRHYLNEEVYKRLLDFCAEHHFSPFRVLLSVWFIYFYRTTGKEDIVLGVLFHNRSSAAEKQTIGTYLSTTPLRLQVEGSFSLVDLIQSVEEEQNQIIRNQKYPLDLLMEDIRETHPTVQMSDLFRVLISYQSFEFSTQYVDQYEMSFTGSELDDLSIHFSDREHSGQLKVDINYRTNLFTENEIRRMFEGFLQLLTEALKNPTLTISKLNMLSHRERSMLKAFNATGVDYRQEATVLQLFEEQARRTPGRIAAVFKDTDVTYAELNQRADRLAALLAAEGVREGGIVGLLVQRSLDMLVCILAVWKAGGAYLPLDPGYPPERIQYILQDSGTDLLLAQSGQPDRISGYSGRMLKVDHLPSGHWEKAPCMEHSPSQLAYLIYTSGSTGNPKGVMIEHRSLHNFIRAMLDRIAFDESKTMLSLTTVSFDIFILENIVPLIAGMKVVIADEQAQVDPSLLADLITREQVDMLQITPSRLRLLLDHREHAVSISRLSEIMIGGEALTEQMLAQVQRLTQAKIYNMYGPTETTVWSAIADVTGCKKVTIGQPIHNTQIHILDDYGNRMAVGAVGEIGISGDGLARGYWNRPELTQQKFISCSWEEGEQESDLYRTRVYRTGDLGRISRDGELECLGRTDNQVKIRGFRVELGEIENTLRRMPQIKECAVICGEHQPGKPMLIAYFVPEGEGTVPDLRAYLAEHLPEYMIPGQYYALDSFPLTPNGKLDRNSLPSVGELEPLETSVYVAPMNEIEEKLVSAWQEVLGTSRIGIHDNFFELGGNSLLLIRLHEKLSGLFPGSALRVVDLFDQPTVSKIANFIKNANKKFCGAGMERILFPKEYFTEPGERNEELTFHFVLSDQDAAQLISRANQYGVQVEDIALSLYMYVICHITENPVVPIQLCSGQNSDIRQLELDLNTYGEIGELISSVGHAAGKEMQEGAYPLACLKRHAHTVDRPFVLPLFVAGEACPFTVRQHFEIILKFQPLAGGFRFDLYYQADKIRRSSAEHFFELYVQAMEIVLRPS
ncbi:amino acid adenylation domain-containing protein [Paenibacillus spiritus]|uniref:Amino acid adenylation domain-containing protein n=1 Tax=Paenibacillus spiritus TaxID=2496557 RepID=A0A5J5GK82_9BACL|nr:non-ribosomal peptide synthetase [Paenibacillus spiritus]KAA9008679.1 amino acid adenylation domain-containing protein [Paenibacillus spiritus]